MLKLSATVAIVSCVIIAIGYWKEDCNESHQNTETNPDPESFQDVEMQYLQFENGYKMPIVGLGTSRISDDDITQTIETALEAGYRHIDIGYMNMNEAAIGEALKRWIDEGKVKREELFIVTKLPQVGMRVDLVEHFMKLSLKALQLDYVDLYSIHSPLGLKYISDYIMFPRNEDNTLMVESDDLEGIWKRMESLVEAGLAKSIGITNVLVKHVERIMKVAKIKPANIQVELHAYFRQKPLIEVCEKYGITVVAYAPLGSPGRTEIYKQKGKRTDVIPFIMDDPVVKIIAEKHNKTPAQVLLRHLVQLNIAVIPKSVTKHRIIENFQILDFQLDSSDMEDLDKLDKGEAGRSFL